MNLDIATSCTWNHGPKTELFIRLGTSYVVQTFAIEMSDPIDDLIHAECSATRAKDVRDLHNNLSIVCRTTLPSNC